MRFGWFNYFLKKVDSAKLFQSYWTDPSPYAPKTNYPKETKTFT